MSEIKKKTKMLKKHITMRFTDEQVKEIDQFRKWSNRSDFIRTAVQEKIERYKNAEK